MKKTLSWNHLLHFRKAFGITPQIQIFLVIGLFLLQSYQAHWMIAQNMNFGGTMPVEWTGILAPIYEEILFRGIILALLFSAFSKWKAILFSSILFGLWHFKNVIYYDLSPMLWNQMIYTSILGIFLAWITIRTQTIWPAVVLHYANNIWAPLSWILIEKFL